MATQCEHTDRPEFAKGMCRPCYEKKLTLNKPKASLCKHTDRNEHLIGLCFECYHN